LNEKDSIILKRVGDSRDPGKLQQEKSEKSYGFYFKQEVKLGRWETGLAWKGGKTHPVRKKVSP